MNRALSDYRVLDLTHVQSDPTCTQLLGFFGADVIKMEPPTGDITRGQLRDRPDVDSLYFAMINCNKRRVTVSKAAVVNVVTDWRASAQTMRFTEYST